MDGACAAGRRARRHRVPYDGVLEDEQAREAETVCDSSGASDAYSSADTDTYADADTGTDTDTDTT